LADEITDALAILEIDVQEYRRQQRVQAQEEHQVELNLRTAARYADQYDVSEEEILVVFNETCDGDWKCVQDYLRENPDKVNQAGHNQRTATQLAAQYGVSEEEIWSLFELTCDGEWKCVRSQLREMFREEHGKGKEK